MPFRPILLVTAVALIGTSFLPAEAATRHRRRHAPPVDMTIGRRAAPVYYGQVDDGAYPSAYSPARPTRQRSWFRQGPVPSVNDSLEGLPPNVTDPPNVRSPGERR